VPSRANRGISADGKTYTLILRKGLKYSDGTAVKASDFPASIKRDYKLDSPGVGFFTNIEGAARFAKTRQGQIAGIAALEEPLVVPLLAVSLLGLLSDFSLDPSVALALPERA